MNARFRIGKTYKFTNIKDSKAYISDRPLVYTGYSDGIYYFKFKTSNNTQLCPKKWIEKGDILVETEWDKRRTA